MRVLWGSYHEAQVWWNSLPEDQKKEMIQIELAWREGVALGGIVQDWIEEHGGERDWWELWSLWMR